MKPPRWIDAGGGDRCVVLLHGVSTRAEAWAPLLPLLATPRLRVLAWDLPGYDGACGDELIGFVPWCDALARLLDAAGIDRCIVVGHSLGGMIALDFAARRPDRLDALVLACTTPGFGTIDGRRQREYLARRLDPLAAGLGMAEIAVAEIPAMMAEPIDGALVERHRALMASIPPAAYAAATRAVAGFDRRITVPGLAMPVLCIAGAEDRLAPPDLLRSMARRAPRGRFEILADAAHLAPFEAPGKFARLLGDFIEATAGSAGAGRHSGIAASR